jgi:hypothetical protein
MSEVEEARRGGRGKTYKNSKEKDVTFRSKDRGVILSEGELQILKPHMKTPDGESINLWAGCRQA